MTIEQTELRVGHRDNKVEASFVATTNAPARLQVWMHDPIDLGRVEVVDIRMFLSDLNVERDAFPVHFDSWTEYLPGSKLVTARLKDAPGWTWRYQNVGGRKIAVPKEVRR